MPKYTKSYIEANVLEEAKARIRHIYAIFDKIYVSFSGGKDSLVVLHLTKQIHDELGLPGKVNVIFRDEEIIPEEVISFVTEYHNSGIFNFYYYAVPLKSHKFVLGVSTEYVQWDNNRKWIRPKPDFAITLPEGDTRVFDQYSMDEFCTRNDKGKVAMITGIRADESVTRLRACINKKNDNYINATATPKVMICKPIYDWSQNDIFKFLYDHKINYCPIYDMELFNQENLRVSTPLHAETAKRLYKLKTLSPTFYQQIVDIFPEMQLQARYWNDLDREKIFDMYPHSFNGILRYIDENIEDLHQADLAKKRTLDALNIRKGKGNTDNFGGYPVLYVFKQIVNGNFKRVILPCVTPTKKMREYEKL